MKTKNDAVLDVVSSLAKVSKDELKPETELVADLGIDSPKALQLLVELEEALEIEISDEEAAKLESIGDILELCAQKQAWIAWETCERIWMSGKAGIPFKVRVYSVLIQLIVGILGCTYRICHFEGEERFEKLDSKSGPVILSAWHNRIFYFSILIRKRLIKKGVKIAMMSSLSKDGEIGAIFGKRIGARVVRGSASRGGTEGFRRFYRLMKKEGCSTIILPDGSKGPIYEAKMGVAMLAKLTGSPVVPMSYSANRYWRVRSWDKLIIPKPFARISIEIGKDIFVDREVDDEGLERCRKQIERTLNELNTRASRCFENKGQMRFRPCIDLKNGRVVQIVGGSLSDDDSTALTNFETEKEPQEFAKLYRNDKLPGGHVIALGPGNEKAALQALQAFPGGLHYGGGVNPENASTFLDAGASHVIVTSYVFSKGKIDLDRLKLLVKRVGTERLVLDLSCRKRDGSYWVVTDRWTRYTGLEVSAETLSSLSEYCDEFLVHGVDVEGRMSGIEDELVSLLGNASPIPATYAGGARSIEDLDRVDRLGQGRVDLTIGSALDIFGGSVSYADVVAWRSFRGN